MAEKRKRGKLKIALYVLLTILVVGVVAAVGGIQYLKAIVFADTPNTLSIEGDLHAVPFRWSAQELGGEVEPHVAMLIPVTVPGIEKKLYMQFDTGSPSTFLLTGPLDALRNKGVKFELVEDEEGTRVKKFKFKIGENVAILDAGRVNKSRKTIDWDDPESINTIGTIGADLIDQRICEIDFPSTEIRLHKKRPASFASLGPFTPFKFKGRRIILPATMDGIEMELFYDSGCSAFGFLTSKYHFERFADKGSKEISYNANRHGDPVFIHHKDCDSIVTLGETQIPVKRVSYAELYSFLQVTLGRVINGGFFGNKSLTESTLILDGIELEFLVVENSLSTRSDQISQQER